MCSPRPWSLLFAAALVAGCDASPLTVVEDTEPAESELPLAAASAPGVYSVTPFVDFGNQAAGGGPLLAAVGTPRTASVRQAAAWTSLGTLSGFTNSFPGASNQVGWVVGWAHAVAPGPDLTQAFLYTPSGGMTPLSGVPAQSRAWGISDNGIIVGDVFIARGRGAAVQRPFMTSARAGAGMTVLGLPPGASAGTAYDVNSHGVAVGVVTVNGLDQAYRWNHDGSHGFLPTSAFTGVARGINDAGTVVGRAGSQAIRWGPSGASYVFLGVTGTATDINASGLIAGRGDGPATQPQAFVHEGGVTKYLNWAPSQKFGDHDIAYNVYLNECGTVIADGETGSVGLPAIFLWSKKGCPA